MLRSIFLGLALLAAIFSHCVLAADLSPTVACDVPTDLVAQQSGLSRLSPLLRTGGRLDVLALGSGSLLGTRGGLEGSVPSHMVEALRAAAPGVTVRLTLHGARAETAAEMLAALRKELAAHTYQLILWQTGSVEAMRRSPPGEFARTLAEGAALVAATGADLVLIDVPFSRLLEERSDLQPYRTAIQQIAEQNALPLFRRYDLMRHWADTGDIDLEAASKHERRGIADRLRACLGHALADLVLARRGS